jgi:outer membrane protein assembly factor BamA
VRVTLQVAIVALGLSVPASSQVPSDSPQVYTRLQCPPPVIEPTNAPKFDVAEVSFHGSLQLPISDQDRIAEEIRQSAYEESADGAADIEKVRAGWQEHGYFEVRVNGEHVVANGTHRALSFDIDEGKQYVLSGITFSNSHIITDPSQLRGYFPISDGAVLNTKKIAAGLASLNNVYRERGYINFNPSTKMEIDEETGSIVVKVDMNEGKRFTIEAIRINGLDEQQSQQLLANFLPKVGEVYNENLFQASMARLLDGNANAAFNSQRMIDATNGTVSVTIDARRCTLH